MPKDFSKSAFITWALIPFAITGIALQDDKGYLMAFAAIIGPFVLLLAALLSGWQTQTVKESLLGTIAGLFVVAVGVDLFLF
jgi:hypothetical protein